MANASVSEIMADAGRTIGGFYAHFESKEALAEEAVHHGLQERRTMFLSRTDDDGWRQRLRSAIRGYFTRQHRDDEVGACPMPMAAIDAARHGIANEAFVDEMSKMAEAFQCGRDPANPRAPREAALGSLALMVGGMILARAAKGTALSEEILKSARAFGDAALSGLGRDSRLADEDTSHTRGRRHE
jgi:TetR/AcrR family transcriptional regulator, transcriptional repressor for nem operon